MTTEGHASDILKASPLEAWKTLQLRFPHLSCVAGAYLGIPASSAMIERHFSIGGLVCSYLRTRLRPEMVGMYIYLRRNMPFFIHGRANKRRAVWATTAEMRELASKLLQELRKELRAQ
jgi:hypothetical protein